jgi:hypothetical protein
MSGSIQTSAGSGRTGAAWTLQLRLGAGVVAILVSFALIFWVKRTTWESVSRAERELSSVEIERFYLGLYFQGGISRLSADLLEFQLTENMAARERFYQQGRYLIERLAATKPHLATPTEQDLAASLESAFQQYLRDTTPLTEAALRPLRRDSVSLIQEQVMKAATPVFRVTEELVRAQRASLDQCFASAAASLQSLHRLLQWSTLLLLLLVAGLSARLPGCYRPAPASAEPVPSCGGTAREAGFARSSRSRSRPRNPKSPHCDQIPALQL